MVKRAKNGIVKNLFFDALKLSCLTSDYVLAHQYKTTY